MKKSLKKKLLFSFTFSFLIISYYFYGIISSKYKPFPYEIIRHLSKKKDKLLTKSTLKRKGRWREARNNVRDTKLSDKQRESLSKIATLPYLQGYRLAPKQEQIITCYDEKSAYNGLNFFTSGHAPRALLMDMNGKILHEWGIQFEDIWSEPLGFYADEEHKKFWRHAHLFKNGDLLAIFERIGLIKLDRDSNLLWSYKGRCHHDLYIAENGNIYVLTHHGPILEDFITILSPEGKEIKSISLMECFLDSDYAYILIEMKKEGTSFHTNTIELFERKIANKAPMFKEGNVLVSMPKINTIAVIDLEEKKVFWAMTGMFKAQHQPTLLKNGNLLIFDNHFNNDKSRVIEFNPLTQEIFWEYRGDSKNDFFSNTCGSNQRLPNGNTLITESDNGRAFEVTPEGVIVWEFISPYRAGENNKLIATLFEMIRIDHDQISCFW